MASYDFFSQPQGITVPISIFGAADAAGVAAGNAQKTTTQAISEGIQGAIKGYLGTEAALQENEIRANQIEQLPIQNQIRAQQLEQEKIETKARKLELEQKTEAQAKTIDYTEAKLDDETLKLQQDTALRKKKDKFNSDFAAADPLTRKQMVFGGGYADLFADDTKLYSQAFGSLDPRSLTNKERAQYEITIGKAGVHDSYMGGYAENSKAYLDAESKLFTDTPFQQAYQTANLSPAQAAQKLIPVEHGRYQTDKEGNILRGESGPLQNPEWDRGTTWDKSWDYVYGNKIVVSQVPKESAAFLSDYRAKKARIDGSDMQRDFREVEDRVMQKYAPKPAPPTSEPKELTVYGPSKETETIKAPEPANALTIQPEKVSKPERAVNLNPARTEEIINIPGITVSGRPVSISSDNRVYRAIQNTLGISDEHFKPIRGDFRTLIQVLDAPNEGIFGKSEAQKDLIANKKYEVARYLGGLDFDTNEETRKSYTEDSVNEHNKMVTQWKQALQNPNRPVSFELQDFLRHNDVHTLIPVTTPKGLYEVKNVSRYMPTLDAIQKAIEKNIKGTRSAVLSYNPAVSESLNGR